ERAILAPQTLHYPEKEGFGELPIAIRHAAGYIEEEKHHGMNRGLAPAGELAITQVLVGERRGRARRTAPLHQLLEGAAPIEPGAGTAAIPTLTHPVGIFRRPDASLEVGELHLLPQPVDDVVDLEFEQQLHLALLLPSRTLLARTTLLGRIGEHIAGLGLALAGALLLLRRAQTKVIVLQHADRHPHGARAAVDQLPARDDLRQVLPHRLADLLVLTQPVARATGEKLVPLGGIAARLSAAALAVRGHDATGTPFWGDALLLCEQGGDVAQGFLGT